MVTGGASEEEAAAIAVALERFLAETAPAPAGPQVSPWQRAALDEGISARQLGGYTWGQPPLPPGR
jgi:hypothetical protein